MLVPLVSQFRNQRLTVNSVKDQNPDLMVNAGNLGIDFSLFNNSQISIAVLVSPVEAVSLCP